MFHPVSSLSLRIACFHGIIWNTHLIPCGIFYSVSFKEFWKPELVEQHICSPVLSDMMEDLARPERDCIRFVVVTHCKNMAQECTCCCFAFSTNSKESTAGKHCTAELRAQAWWAGRMTRVTAKLNLVGLWSFLYVVQASLDSTWPWPRILLHAGITGR